MQRIVPSHCLPVKLPLSSSPVLCPSPGQEAETGREQGQAQRGSGGGSDAQALQVEGVNQAQEGARQDRAGAGQEALGDMNKKN